ncbi:MAG: hypothetical protein D6696_05770 [Acidobacteria bacterium]|nr:MAG: hypothetical protein D6696_05770 [Acidobacteriota bacterium]
MTFEVHSEIGRLRRVLIHRPGLEIDWMVPSMMERLLFDDILYGEEARQEHDAFCGVLRAAGVETLDPQRLLAEVLAGDSVRRALLARLGDEHGVEASLCEELAELEPAELARALISGLLAPETAPPDGTMRSFYRLPPVPNFFFQRDPQAVLGRHVLISSMATEAREREPLLAETVFRHHPALAGGDAVLTVRRRRPGAAMPRIEGGDLLVASPEVLLAGLSERTDRWGIEALATRLREVGASFRHLVVVELPPKRSYMHLDTVFTFIDHGLCLAYLPVIAPGGSESGHVYRIDLTAPAISYTVCDHLPGALAALGIEVELVPCGGSDSIIDQQREQWTDGANAFAIAPGVIVIYRRNRRTAEALARRGWRVIEEEAVLSGREPLLGHGPTVVTLLGDELSRARGGPRCMTMPLVRDRG